MTQETPKTLATLAVRSRRLKVSQLAELLRAQGEEGGELLELAVERGYLSHEDAQAVRKEHLALRMRIAGRERISGGLHALLDAATQQQPLVRFVTRSAAPGGTARTTAERVSIFMIDDDPANQDLMRAHLQIRGVDNPLFVANDGEQALAMLRGAGGQAVPRPFVIVLDLNMPRMNGFQFLDALRSDPAHKDTIVLVMTTSASEQDLLQAEQRDVAGYFVRDDTGEGFLRAMNELFSSYA